MPRPFSLALQSLGFTTVTLSGALLIYTKHSSFTPSTPFDHTDPVYAPLRELFTQSATQSSTTPAATPSSSETCLRRIPITKLDPVLYRDDQEGGNRLVTKFARGVFGGNAVGLGSLSTRFSGGAGEGQTKPLTSAQLEDSQFDVGTVVANGSYTVFARPSRSSIVLGTGRQRQAREMLELSTEVNVEQGFTDFRIRQISMDGSEGRKGFTERLWIKYMIEEGARKCMKSHFIEDQKKSEMEARK